MKGHNTMNTITNFIEEKDNNTLLCVIAAFLAGLVVGFVISPVKKGINIGSCNGAYNSVDESFKADRKKK